MYIYYYITDIFADGKIMFIFVVQSLLNIYFIFKTRAAQKLVVMYCLHKDILFS